MSDAITSQTNKSVEGATIRPEEAEHFGQLARQWWDPSGPMASLHKVNPLRLKFIRLAVDAHWGCDPGEPRPLAGKNALDAGCGAGLICEPLARLGAQVTGVDASSENIGVAREHAAGAGLDVEYVAGDLGGLELGRFDLVVSLEVIEHVADKTAFLAGLAAALKPGGLLVMSTPNRTAASKLLLVEAAERVGFVPRGTHDWNDFVTPDELRDLMAEAGLKMGDPIGIGWSPAKGMHLTDNLALNYIFTAQAE